MNGYEFSNYGIFSSAIGTTNTVKTTFDTAGTDINSVNQIISDDGVFMGPIADECRNAISLLNTDLTMINENFSMIQNFLAETSQNYQTTDKNAATTITGSKDGVLDLGFGTTGSGNSNVGTPDFSNNAAWISENPYSSNYTGQCTWFAWGKFYETYGYSPGFTGNGADCARQLVNAHSDKFELSNTPVAGAIFSETASGSHPYGHTGIVKSVNSDGTITIQEGNLNSSTDTFEVAKTDWQEYTATVDEIVNRWGGYGGIEFANPK